MKKYGVFIMNAGRGTRLQYSLGSMIPKCLLPLKLVDKNAENGLLINRILQAVKKMSLYVPNMDVHLIINDEYPKPTIDALYDSDNGEINYIHRIPWSESSISTFLFCDDLIRQNKYDEVVFINGDCYFRGLDSLDAFERLINTSGDCAIVECAPEGRPLENVWSSVGYNNRYELSFVKPDWCDTVQTLRDVTKLTAHTYFKLAKIARNLPPEKSTIWWEMLFIDLINFGELKMKAIIIEPSDQDSDHPSPAFINVNSIRSDLNMGEALTIVKNNLPELFEKE